LICPQLEKPICIFNVTTTGKDGAQYYKWKRLDYSEKKEWKTKSFNSNKGDKNSSIDSKGVFAYTVKGIYYQDALGLLKEEGK